MMICNNCGGGVSYHPISKSWMCTACGAVDPPIRVQPFKTILSMNSALSDESILMIRPKSHRPKDALNDAQDLARSEEQRLIEPDEKTYFAARKDGRNDSPL